MAAALLSCARRPDTEARPTIDQVLDAHRDSLMRINGVVGVGIGLCGDAQCIKVFLSSRTLETQRLPTRLEGYEVSVEETGIITPRRP